MMVDFPRQIRVAFVGRFEDDLVRSKGSVLKVWRWGGLKALRRTLDPFVSLCVAR